MSVPVWKTLLTIVLGLLLPLALCAQTADTLTSAEEVITRAKVFADRKDYDGAVGVLTHALEKYPTYQRLYLTLANYQMTRGLSPLVVEGGKLGDTLPIMRQNLNKEPYIELTHDLFETYGRAMMYTPDPQVFRRRVTELLTDEYPVSLGEYGPLALPGNPAPFTFTLTDPVLPTERRCEYQGMTTTLPLPVTQRYAKDPKYGQNPGVYRRDPRYADWQFQYMLLAYEYTRETRSWRLRFRVCWQDVPGQQAQRAQMARQVAMLLLRCSAMLRAYSGLEPRFSDDGTVNVWLAEKGEAGGESYNDSLYLQQIGVQRSDAEWVREVIHEYGHQTLPTVGGYKEPEWSASGILGERLYLRWLLRNANPRDEIAWLRGLDAPRLTEERINRLMRQYATVGPESPVIHGDDRAALDVFVGMALWLDTVNGSSYVLSRLKSMSTPSYAEPGGFLSSVESKEQYNQAGEITHPVLTVPLSALPAATPLWLYLKEGRTGGKWRGEFECANAMPAKSTVEIDGKPAAVDATGIFTTTPLKSGWHQLKITGEGTEAFTALKLVRQ